MSSCDSRTMPIFPLGTPLLPSQLLPLQVFEPRYVNMFAESSLDRGDEFGVVLIERGNEVGGGEVRTNIGCTAAVLEIHREEDGKAALLSMGAERFRVDQWLRDDPYPLARITLHPDPAADRLTIEDLAAAGGEAKSTASLACELGGPPLPVDLEWSGDPATRLWQLCLLAPLGALDRHHLLCCPDPTARLSLLVDLLSTQRVLLEARLQ